MTELFYTVNAGVYISTGKTALLIDGIHGAPSGFSAMPEGLYGRILQGTGMFARLDGILFTHLHPDHYDADKTDRVLENRPGTALWGPGLAERGIREYRETPAGCMFRIGDLRIFAYPTVHSGKPFREVPHCSFLIRNESSGESFLISGDAVFSPDLADTIKENAGGPGMVAAAFINVYHLIEEPSRDFLLRLAPRHLFLYHRPLPEDDCCNYLFMIRTELRKDPLPGYTILQPEQMDRIRYEET